MAHMAFWESQERGRISLERVSRCVHTSYTCVYMRICLYVHADSARIYAIIYMYAHVCIYT